MRAAIHAASAGSISASRRAMRLGQPVQRRAVDVLHRDEVGVVDDAELVDRHDVAVRERDQGLGLGDEQVDEVPLARQPRMDLLDDERLLEAAGTDELGEVDLGHAAGGELLGQVVLAERRRQLRHRRARVSCGW